MKINENVLTKEDKTKIRRNLTSSEERGGRDFNAGVRRRKRRGAGKK